MARPKLFNPGNYGMMASKCWKEKRNLSTQNSKCREDKFKIKMLGDFYEFPTDMHYKKS